MFCPGKTKPLYDRVDMTYHLWFSWLQIVCVEAHPSGGFDYTIAETKSNVNTSFASDQARKLNCRKFVLSACIQFARFCFYVS